MKKSKTAIYCRYEFSNETGTPEGGDIFKFSSLKEVQEMASEIIKVAQDDAVTVNITMGGEKPFFGFLKKLGMSQQDIQKEMVDRDLLDPAPAKKKASKKKASPAKTKTKKK